MATRNGFHVVCPEVATFRRVRVTPTLELCATQFNIRSCCSSSSLIFKFLSNKRHNVHVRCKPNCGLLKVGQTLTITATMPLRAWQQLRWLEDDLTRRNSFRRVQQLVLVVQPVSVHGDVQASLQLLRRNSEGAIRYSLRCLRSNAGGVLRAHRQSEENVDPAIATASSARHASLEGLKPRKVRRGQGVRAQGENPTDRLRQQQGGTPKPPNADRTPASILKRSMQVVVSTTKSSLKKNNSSSLAKRRPLWRLHSDLAKAWLPCVASALRMVVQHRHSIEADVRKALGDFMQYTATVSQQIHRRLRVFFANRRKGASQVPRRRTAGVCVTSEVTGLQQIEIPKQQEACFHSTESQTTLSKCAVFEVLCRRLGPTSADSEFDASSTQDIVGGETVDERSVWSSGWFEVQKPSGYVWKSGEHASCRRFTCDGFFDSSCTPETVGRRVYKSFCLLSSQKEQRPRKVDLLATDLSNLDRLSPFSIIAMYGETVRCRRRLPNSVSEETSALSQQDSAAKSKPVENFREIHSLNSRVIRSFVKGLLSDAAVSDFGGKRRTTVSVSMLFCFKGVFYDTLGREPLSFQQAKSKFSNKPEIFVDVRSTDEFDCLVAESVHFMDSDPGAFNRPELKQAARALGHSLTIIRVRTKELEEDPNTLAEQPGMTGAGFNGKSIEAPRVFVFVDVGGCRKPSRALLASLTSSSAVHGSHNSKAWQIELQKLAAQSQKECAAVVDVVFAIRDQQRLQIAKLFDPFRRLSPVSAAGASTVPRASSAIRRQQPDSVAGCRTQNTFAQFRQSSSARPGLPAAVRRQPRGANKRMPSAKTAMHPLRDKLRCLVPHRRTAVTSFLEMLARQYIGDAQQIPDVVFVGTIDDGSNEALVRETHNTADLVDRLSAP